jgi:hypothetical protein
VQPALTVNSDGLSNCESLSFSFDGLSGALFFLPVQIPDTGISVPVPLPPISILRPSLAAQLPIPHRFEMIDDAARLGPISGPLVGLSKAALAMDSVSGQGSLNVLQYGTILNARSLVDVRGVGLAYDGRYYVKSVTHNIKRGEYKQSFNLVREGLIPLENTVQVS